MIPSKQLLVTVGLLFASMSVEVTAPPSMAPAIVLTMIFQKYVVKGLTMGAVKG